MRSYYLLLFVAAVMLTPIFGLLPLIAVGGGLWMASLVTRRLQ